VSHRRPRQADPPEQAVLSLAARHPTCRRKRSDEADRNRPAPAALPSVERSCDHPDQSAPPHKAGTSAASPCAPARPETAPTSVQAHQSNPNAGPPWSTLTKSRPPMNHVKSILGIPKMIFLAKSAKVVLVRRAGSIIQSSSAS